MRAEEEDRILRVWTPVILRTVLAAAAIVLILGLIAMATVPGEYVDHFRAVQDNDRVKDYGNFLSLLIRAWHGNPRSIMTLGLMILTLVPLARVAFCLMFFIKSRNKAFVIFTAYVLAGLAVGVMLGRIG
ncbi:MAG TPA: DUF1634 domain-containing protein [Candidatus Binataceae bacterium]|jgi:uncharacterized membrane protein|nr:DUF1634 domain-containing protein [Candidatus Binataceae bacterium]